LFNATTLDRYVILRMKPPIHHRPQMVCNFSFSIGLFFVIIINIILIKLINAHFSFKYGLYTPFNVKMSESLIGILLSY